MEAKMNAISEAYKESWRQCSSFVNNNGFCEFNYVESDITRCGVHYSAAGFKQFEVETTHIGDTMYWRPKCLTGLEDNNGWIRCDDRMPEEHIMCHFCITGVVQYELKTGYEIRVRFEQFPEQSRPSHWRPIDQVKPPIY